MKFLSHKFWKLLLLILLCSTASNVAMATHLVGGSIHYEYLGKVNSGKDAKYKIIVKLYRDPFSGGAEFDNPIQVGFYIDRNDPSKRFLQDSLDMPLISKQDVEPPKMPRCATTGSGAYTIEEGIYEAEVILPINANGYHLVYSRCCRSYALTNLSSDQANQIAAGAAYYAYIPSGNIVNSSSVFSQPPIPGICSGNINNPNSKTFFMNSATDADGDSLSFELVAPNDNSYTSNSLSGPPPTAGSHPLPTIVWPIQTVTYNSGYSTAQPFGSIGGASIEINGENGVTTAFAPFQGFYAVAVMVKEFRKINGIVTLVGIVRRELQIIVEECTNPGQPAVITKSNGSEVLEDRVEEGYKICTDFRIVGVKAGEPVFVEVKGDLFNPSKTQQNPGTKQKDTIGGIAPTPLIVSYCWDTECGQARAEPYEFEILAYAGCNPPVLNLKTVKVFVDKPKVSLTAAIKGICPNQKNQLYQISDTAGGATYTWNVVNGTKVAGGGSSDKSVTINWNIPDGQIGGKITVIKRNRYGCTGVSEFDIPLDNNALPVNAGPDAVGCQGKIVTIGTNAEPSTTYIWSGGTGIINPTQSNTGIILSQTTTYTLSVVDNNGCSGSDQVLVVVNPVPDASISPRSETICPGISFGKGAGLVPVPGMNYTWQPAAEINGANNLFFASMKTQNATSNMKTVTYTVTVTSQNSGCSSTNSFILNIQPEPSFVVSSVPADSVCPNLPINFTASKIGNTYKWYTGSPLSLRAEGQVVSFGVPTSGVVTVIGVSSSTGCADTLLKTLTTRIPPGIAIEAQPSASICLYDTVAVQAVGTHAYVWADQSGNVISNTATFTDNPALTSSYTVTATDGYGCVNTATQTITVKPLPTLTINAQPAEICYKTTSSLQVNSAGATDFEWALLQKPDVVVFITNPVTTTLSQTTTYIVTVTGSNQCRNTGTQSVTVLPIPPVKILVAGDSLCPGTSSVLFATGGNTYEWNTIPVSNTSFTPNVSFEATANTTYILKGTDTKGCVKNDTVAMIVRTSPPVSALHISPSAVCPGEIATMHARGAKNYKWFLQAGGALIGTDSILSVSPRITSTYIVLGTDRAGCTNQAEIAVTVHSKPETPPIVGPKNVCPGANGVQYKVIPPDPSSNYRWEIFDNKASFTDGVDFGATRLFTFRRDEPLVNISVIQTHNTTGCKDTQSVAVTLKINYVPPAPLGPPELCFLDAQNILYTVPDFNNTARYHWFVSQGAILDTSVQGQANVKWYSQTTGVPAEIGYVEESTTADTSCYFNSLKRKVIVNPNPTASRILGDTSVCHFDQEVLYTLPGGFPNSTYKWGVSPVVNTSFTTGVDGSSVRLSWLAPGIYTITTLETSNKGCVGPLVNLPIIVNPLPTIVGVYGDTIVCRKGLRQNYNIVNSQIGSRYVWKVSNGLITNGQNNDTVTIDWQQPGSGQVAVYEVSKDSCLSEVKTFNVLVDNSLVNLDLVSTHEENENYIEVHWPTSFRANNLSEYTLYRVAFKEGTPPIWKTLTPGTVPSYIDKSIEINTDKFIYQYYYSLINACNVPDSSLIHNTILLVAKGNEDNNLVSLKWNSYQNWNNEVFTYQVYRKLDKEEDFRFYADAGTDTSVSFDNSTDGFRHVYRIKAKEINTDAYSWSNDSAVTFEHQLFIPNTITPNGDGKNDKWVIRNIAAYKYSELTVYSRWGQKVYESKGYKNTWNGTFEGAGRELPDGTYYYVLKLNVNRQPNELSGPITILR